MGEQFQGQKSFVCSFFECKAKFSKSWKLEAHLCKHTGLVSGFSTTGGQTGGRDMFTWTRCNQLFLMCPMFLQTSETVLLRELRQELLHTLSTHKTPAEPQWGEATQVSHDVYSFSSWKWLPFTCYLLWIPGVWSTGALRPLSPTAA